LGRKIEKREIVLASVVLLVHPIVVLFPVLSLPSPDTYLESVIRFHGISQVVYEYASAGANNGSGFEGLGDNTLWWNLSACFSLLGGRYMIIALLLLADSMTPAGTRNRRNPKNRFALITGVTAGVILILGADFLSRSGFGPIAEAFQIAV